MALGIYVLAACSSSQALAPTVSQAPALGAARAATGDLLYAGVRHNIEVYAFPTGTFQERFVTKGYVNGMCSDADGNVFVAAAAGKSSQPETGYLEEYAHGGRAPIASLDVPKDQAPVACSSDPITGNLAVTLENSHNYTPSVAIYAKASGAPTVYTSNALGANPQAGYDDDGNLLATSGGNVAAELLKGKTSFATIELAQTLGGVGHVQWDGKYFALQSFDATRHNGEKIFERIYRITISGSTGKVVGKTTFDDWPENDPGQSWIDAATIVATPLSEIVFWQYPAGGKPTKIVHSHDRVKAVTVSAAQ
ncbi:MAG TPA: hypothetical protein VFF63_00245 [Candidatus Babeliales bacterium]|nr:hypothetical protein [Candidatus Babeliales bacterium]